MNQTSKNSNNLKSNGLRPKRCHICRKMFNPQKYDQHFSQCYRFQKDKLDHQTDMIKQSRIKHNNIPTRQIVSKGNSYKVIQPKTNNFNNFRIKNMTGSLIKNQSNLNSKKQTKHQIMNPESQKKQKQHNIIEIKQKLVKKQQTKIQIKSYIKQEEKHTTKQEERRAQQPIRKEQVARQQIQIANQPSQSQSQSSEQNQENYIISQPVAQNHTFVNINNQDVHSEPQQEDQEPPNLIERARSHNSVISQLVANTVQIISFIQRLNINDPTLDIMVEQLSHVNQIAQQVVELNLIGNSLGFTMQTIFGPRIQELQTAIISQVSMAILRSFNNRLSSQFQQLIDRNPAFRNGFSKEQIQKNFKSKKCKKQGQCPICLQQYPKQTFIIQLQCYHAFHDDCIQNWFNSSKNCPMCRKQQKLF